MIPSLPQYTYGSNEELQRYFALLVQNLQQLIYQYGVSLPPLTNAEVAIIINGTLVPYFTPVVKAGTQWFNSDTGKMQFIAQQAVLGVSNAVVETITSV